MVALAVSASSEIFLIHCKPVHDTLQQFCKTRSVFAGEGRTGNVRRFVHQVRQGMAALLAKGTGLIAYFPYNM